MMPHRTALVRAFLLISVALATRSGIAQKSKTLKAASGSIPHATITIDRPFTQEMADNARLDIKQPQLSDDGVRADSAKKLASSECLLFETLVAERNKVSSERASSFCEAAANTTTAEQADKVKSQFEEQAGTRIDDALIHVVVWDNKHKAQGQWYHYERHAGKWSGSLFSFDDKGAVRELDDVLGHGNVAFLAIHLGIDDSCDITYDIEAKHTSGINQKDFTDLIQLVKDFYGKGSGTAKAAATNNNVGQPPPPTNIGVWGGETLLRLPQLPASISIDPSTGKTVGSSTFRDHWNVGTGCKAEQDATKPHKSDSASSADGSGRTPLPFRAAVWRSETNPIEPVAAQGATKATDGGDKSKDPLGAMGVTVQDEGLHRWDVSVALPVTAYNKLKFDSQNNFLTVKNTNDIKPYGLFDFYPWPAKLQAKKALSPPRFSAGLPMASKPLQQPFVGGGFTLAIGSFRFAPLAGVRIQKEQRTTTLTPGAPANAAQLTNDLHSEWHVKLQVMIGFSIQDARKALGLK